MGHDLSTNLFLLFHDAFTGKLEISQELFECAVVTAELADLMLAGHLAMDGDRVVITSAPTDIDAVGAYVMDSIGRQPKPHTVRTWVESLGPAATELIARRLLDDGVIRREQRRSLLGRSSVRYPALDLIKASGPRVRLVHMLAKPGSFDLQGALSGAIVGALGVERIFDVAVDRQLFVDLDSHLPSSMRTLMSGLAAAVAAVSLTIRR